MLSTCRHFDMGLVLVGQNVEEGYLAAGRAGDAGCPTHIDLAPEVLDFIAQDPTLQTAERLVRTTRCNQNAIKQASAGDTSVNILKT